MPSISSATRIQERTLNFCNSMNLWKQDGISSALKSKINQFFQNEYELIPDKERVGKGPVYISKYISKALVPYLKKEYDKEPSYFLSLSEGLFEFGNELEDVKVQHLALYLFAEFIYQFPKEFKNSIPLIEKWADHSEWQIRESIGEAILSSLKKNKDKTLEYVNRLVESKNENLRRLVSESLRPRADIKWLRDPTKNDKILELLTRLRKDNSIYVRKSVGNNIKDLSKYMPEKMLDLMEKWIEKSGIKVHDELATEVGLNKQQKQLIWTMKQGMRWIKDRNPEYHERLERILGKNYLIYFDEKGNRLAKPR